MIFPIEKAPAIRDVAIDRFVCPAMFEAAQLKTMINTATIYRKKIESDMHLLTVDHSPLPTYHIGIRIRDIPN